VKTKDRWIALSAKKHYREILHGGGRRDCVKIDRNVLLPHSMKTPEEEAGGEQKHVNPVALRRIAH